MQNLTRIGTLGLLAIVALRVGIGWHFFKEGSDKIQSGNFSSEGFLKNSQGRFAGFYQGMVWDHDGKIRLDEMLMLSKFDEGEQAAIKHFGLTDVQQKALKAEKNRLVKKLKEVYATHEDAIIKHDGGEERVAKMSASPVWSDISSLRGQKDKIAKERITDVYPALESVDFVWQQYGEALNSVATPEQLASGQFQLRRPQEGLISSQVVDKIIPIFDITVGISLILGLFVRVFGLAAAAFLISVVLSQFPGDPNTQPTYLYAVEALALVVLVSIGAGRFAGLDFILWAWRQNRRVAPAGQAAQTARPVRA
jgi:uncharacterized membrane protein YphA (DoxX/SURF4 family)